MNTWWIGTSLRAAYLSGIFCYNRWLHSLSALLIIVVVLLTAIDADAQQWIAAWSVSHDQQLTTPAMSGTSVRMIVRPTISGDSVRIKLENTFGQSRVEFSSAYIGQVQSAAALVPGSNKQLTFEGQKGKGLDPGEAAYSDPIAFPVQAFQQYAISLDVKAAQDISAHALGLVTNYMAQGAHAEDVSALVFGAIPKNDLGVEGPTFPFYWVAALDVAAQSTTGTIVAFGDSITDGECSTRSDNGSVNGKVLPDLYDRWTDLLAERLSAAPGNHLKAVANEGIAGNRVVGGGVGEPALLRMDRDMLDREGVSQVIFFEGTNDIANDASAATVIAGYQQVIERVHAAGLKIIGATIIPRGGNSGWTTGMERQRVTLNDWIRHHANFDGLIDFDSLMEGPVNKDTGAVTIRPEWSCFDGIHPNSAGYAAMAGFIDLDLFNNSGESITPVSLVWIPGSSVKLQQLIGEKGGKFYPEDEFDMADVDRQTGSPLLNQTYNRYKIGGTDLGYSFQHGHENIFLFGDTLYFQGGDVMGRSTSTSTNPEAGLLLDFFTNGDGSTLLVQPPGIDMGSFNVPDSGISIEDQIYVVCKTGYDAKNPDPNGRDVSVLTRFDEATKQFTVLRDISKLPDGKFIEMALHQVSDSFVHFSPWRENLILMWGSGEYRKSDVYLARAPAKNFETGNGTLYFTGFDKHGATRWSDKEADANAVVTDGTIGNVSVTYAHDLGLWLMTYDSRAQAGVVFRYAKDPQGPWSAPQVIFDPSRDNGFGHFIHDPGIVPDDGIGGPVIGDNDPKATRGADYAPYVIERFTKVEGGKLVIYYTLSTWNPYTVLLMRSEFRIRGVPKHPPDDHFRGYSDDRPNGAGPLG